MSHETPLHSPEKMSRFFASIQHDRHIRNLNKFVSSAIFAEVMKRRGLVYYQDEQRPDVGKGAFDHLFPSWKYASSVFKAVTATLAIENMGYELHGLSVNLGEARLDAFKGNKRKLAAAIGKAIRRRLLENLGYAHFWFCLDVSPYDPNNPNSGRLHLHGAIGFLPGDKDPGRKCIKSVSGDWSDEARPVFFRSVRSVIALVRYSHKNTSIAVLVGDGSTYYATHTVTRASRRLYESTPKDFAFAKEINRTRTGVPYSVQCLALLDVEDQAPDVDGEAYVH